MKLSIGSKRQLLALLVLGCSGIWAGCGATSASPTTKGTGGSSAVQVAVAPTQASVHLGATAQFTATVSNASNTAVTWSVNGAAGGSAATGTIDSTGLYTAPAAMPASATITITATSVQDTTQSASAAVTLLPAVTVAVTPATVTLALSATQAFQATVTGDSNQAVSWSVNDVAGGNSTVGTIDASGNYTAPATLPSPATVTVTATSQADASVKGTAQVTLQNSVQVTLAPVQPSLRISETLQFTATVSNASNTAVAWSVNGAAGGSAATGTIDSTGLYTAPATLPTPATVTVTATSVQDAEQSASTTVTLLPALTVTVTPASVTLDLKATQAFQATITGDTNQAVSWSVNTVAGGNSTVGTIDASGNYTAPATLPSPATVTVTATSQADAQAKGTAEVTLKPGDRAPDYPRFGQPLDWQGRLRDANLPDRGARQLHRNHRTERQRAAAQCHRHVDKSQLTGDGSATLTLTSASFSLAQSAVPVTVAANATDSAGTLSQQTATVNFTITGWKGQVHTLAGLPGGVGFADGTGSSAELQANALTNDGAGTLYFIDGRGKALRTAQISTGTVATLVGSPYGFAIPYGEAIAWDSSRQTLYASDSATSVILKYHLGDNYPSVLAGTGTAGAVDGPDATAQFNGPIGIALSPDHNSLYVADSGNDAIRKIDLVGGTVSTIAGQLGVQGSVDGVGAAALLAYPWGLDIDPLGKYLYFSEHWGPKIRRLTLADGTVTTLSGSGTPGTQDGPAASATFTLPQEVRVDPHDNGADLLYIVDDGKIRALTLGASPVVFTVAGQEAIGAQDGAGAQATFYAPQDLTVVPDLTAAGTSSLFVADTGNGLIRRIDVSSPAAAATAGTITANVTTLAGGAAASRPGRRPRRQYRLQYPLHRALRPAPGHQHRWQGRLRRRQHQQRHP